MLPEVNMEPLKDGSARAENMQGRAEHANLLLDRAVLFMLVLGATGNRSYEYILEDVRRVFEPYRIVLYERPGTSVFEKRLKEMMGFSEKLVGLPEGVEPDTNVIEAGLIQTTKNHACFNPSILLAHKQYQSGISAASHRSCQEDIDYIIKLLRLARQFESDILTWSLRKHLFLSLFEAAAINGTSSALAKGTSSFVSDPCRFPYLPPMTDAAEREKQIQFGILFYEPPPEASSGQSPSAHLPSSAMTVPVAHNKIFVSYCHKDKVWLERLKTILSPVVGENLEVWDDTRIETGAKWKEDIENAIATAKVAVLLVSDNFLASKFIADHELPRFLNMANRGSLKIYWIPVSYSLYDETEIASYQAAHDPSKPLDSLKGYQRKKALTIIGKKILESFQSS